MLPAKSYPNQQAPSIPQPHHHTVFIHTPKFIIIPVPSTPHPLYHQALFQISPPPLRISTPYSTFTTTPIAIRTFPFYIPIASNSFIPTSYIQSYSPPPISTLNTSYFHKHPRPPISTLNTPYFTLTPIPYFHSKPALNTH